MSLLAAFKGTGPSGFGYGSSAEQVTEGLDLRGKTFLITGSTSGLGVETVRVLALRGARVLAAGRNREKVAQVLAGVSGDIVPVACELAEPHSVRQCVALVKREGLRLDGIICNAGIMALPELQQAFGYELQFFTNHVGHFLLVTELLGELTERGRVVMVSSGAHRWAPSGGIQLDNVSGERGYSPQVAYGQSKLANLLFAKQLAKRLAAAGSAKTANALHPGVIKTSLWRSMSPVVRLALSAVEPIGLKSIAEGAATQCYVATRPELDGVSGEYFADCNVAKPTALAQDGELAERLWVESERIVRELR